MNIRKFATVFAAFAAFAVVSAYAQDDEVTSFEDFDEPVVESSASSEDVTKLSTSRLAVASSRSTMGASLRMARAMEMRWRSPPESVSPFSPMTVS